MRRNSSGRLDPHGDVWGVPYRWGCTLVAFDQQKLARCCRLLPFSIPGAAW